MQNIYESKNYYKKYPFQVFVHESTECGSLHGQDFYEIFITYSDNCVYYVNGEIRHLPAGTAVLSGPNDVHRIGPSDDNVFKYINMSFPEEILSDLEQYLHTDGEIRSLFSAKDRNTVSLNETQTEKWKARMKSLVVTALKDAEEAELEMRSLLTQIFTKLYLRREEDMTALPSWLADLCYFLNKDTNFALSLDEIASHAQKTKEHLCRSMKRYLGVSPMEYVNDIRIRYAASMLENSDMSIMDIYLSAGFFSSSYFNKLFRIKYGVSPTEYRRINQY